MTLTAQAPRKTDEFSADDFDLDIKIGREMADVHVPEARTTWVTWLSCACGGTCATCNHFPGTNCVI